MRSVHPALKVIQDIEAAADRILSVGQFTGFLDGIRESSVARVVEVSSRSYRDLTAVKETSASRMHWLHLGFPGSDHEIPCAWKYICSLVRWHDSSIDCLVHLLHCCRRAGFHWLETGHVHLAGEYKRGTGFRQSRGSSCRPLAEAPIQDMGIELGMSCNIP